MGQETEQGPVDAVVAGHICLDIIPRFAQRAASMSELIVPGKLVEVGSAAMSTGGAVSNAGLALHRLGVHTRLMGKVGDDVFGRAILELLQAHEAALTADMIIDGSVSTSYSVVLNPPGIDRVFLHCPGANDAFGADDIPYDRLAGVRLFHFGYPPLMGRMFLNGGTEPAAIYRRVKERGVTTALDMALPDPRSEAGQQDWVAILDRVLPFVDVFLPSYDETLFMLRPALTGAELALAPAEGVAGGKGAILGVLAERLLAMGAALVVLKLGDEGLYVRTTPDRGRLEAMGACRAGVPDAWLGRELLMPCFRVDVVGTTGAGDCTIAGFLAALLRDRSVEAAMTCAVGVGAFNVEEADATSGVPTWEALTARLSGDWARRETAAPGAGWQWREEDSLWVGPVDAVG